MNSVELYANTSRSAKFNSKNYRFKLTSIALANEPFSVSTARQKSSSSDVGTFRRPACCLTVKCQQKGGTKQLISLSNAAHGQTCLIFDASTSRDENWCVVTWRDRRTFELSGIAMHAGILLVEFRPFVSAYPWTRNFFFPDSKVFPSTRSVFTGIRWYPDSLKYTGLDCNRMCSVQTL